MELMTLLDEILEILVEVLSMGFEYVGVLIIMYAGVKSIINLCKRNPHTGYELGKCFSLSLTFMMAAEILKSVTSKNLMDISEVGAIIALRAALVFLLHWEGKGEREEMKE